MKVLITAGFLDELERIVQEHQTGLLSDGASRDRTGDLLLAKQALSQLSYGPAGCRV